MKSYAGVSEKLYSKFPQELCHFFRGATHEVFDKDWTKANDNSPILEEELIDRPLY